MSTFYEISDFGFQIDFKLISKFNLPFQSEI